MNEIDISNKIHTLRGIQVILDKDLAELYEVETRVLNQAVKRNIERFPNEFMFRLNESELSGLRSQNNWTSQNVISNKEKMGLRKPPYAFSEQGVTMLSCVLRSKTAIEVSIQIINAFVAMRKFISRNAGIFSRLDIVERKQLECQIKTDEKFEKVFEALQVQKPKQGIFFEGQIFDAYKFVSDLVRGANRTIVLIDNYVDDSVLTLFSKSDADVTVFTKNYSKELKLDLEKYNSQHKPITIKEFNNSHDRFMIIDDKQVYHFGASLKDLGKKWFAFSRFDKEAFTILEKLKKCI